MGQRIQFVSFLCGAFKKKHPAAADAAGNVPPAPEDPPSNLPSPRDGDSSPLPPPAAAGHHHMRAASCSQQRSGGGAASKLVSSMSMKVLGSAAAAVGRQASSLREKRMKPEDSIWKKTIILGEKCRVPDEEDEESILYDEKGKRIPTYHHRRTKSLVFSRDATLAFKEQEESSSSK